MLSSEELDLAMRYIKVPYVKKVIERDMAHMEKSKDLKMYEVYVEHLRDISFKVSRDIRVLKATMKKVGMSVHFIGEKEDNIKFLSYKVIVRGKETETGLFNHHLKNDVAKILTGYLRG